MRTHLAFVPLALLALVAGACLGMGGEAEKKTVPLPKLTPFSAALELQLAGIVTKAAEVRELEINEGVTQGTLTKKQYAQYYDKVALDARLQADTNFEALDTTYHLLHMIEPDESILDTNGKEAADWTLGFYVPESDHLVLISDQPKELSLSNEATLAHEFVHSFQDQAFDLNGLLAKAEKDVREKGNTEYYETLDALIEGDAVVAQMEYIRAKYGERGLNRWFAASEQTAKELSNTDQGPAALGRYTAFPYVYGSAFVRHLFNEGGWGQVNQAYENPPTTEEQILHPEKYLRGEGAQEISLRDLSDDLGEGWVQEMDAVFGEFDVYNWLRSTLDSDFQATSAAAGWGGGRIAVYSNERNKDRALLHIALLWDSRQEAREFYFTFSDAIKLIDPKPKPLDFSFQLMEWRAENEAGRAWVDGTTFQMVVAPSERDLNIALEAIDAPRVIPQSGFILAEARSSESAVPPVHRLEDILLRQGELPPGYVKIVSSDTNVAGPFGGGGVDDRSVFYSDVRSPGQGVLASATLFKAAVGGGLLWSDLRRQPPRQFFDLVLDQVAVGGRIVSFQRMNAGSVGAASLGARVVVQPNGGGPRQRIEMIAFGRDATMVVVATVEPAGEDPLDIHRFARLMDQRLKRFTP